MPAVNASEKAKEKAELGARFGSKLSMSMGYKKDIFAGFAYEFELSPFLIILQTTA